ENPPPYPGKGPTASYPPYAQQRGGPPGYPPGSTGPYQPGQPDYWQNAPLPPGPVYADEPKTIVYVIKEWQRDDSGESTCLIACWTTLCCCCLWDM
ncbi:CYTM1 protein, partial [Aramus guarauna]|nr:CYTM1 protein [Aramus guarauna]